MSTDVVLLPSSPTRSRYTFKILAPHQAHSGAFVGICEADGKLHHRYLNAMQRLRGRVYLCDGAIRQHEVELDGRFRMDGDEDAWHLLLVDEADEIIGCARYMVHPKTAAFGSLRISHSTLARDWRWAQKLRYAVEADLQLALAADLLYVEIGGWALSEEWRQTKAALETAVGSYALGNLWGGAIGSCTATARHGSASILHRLGGTSLQADGETLPVYFDPQYGCNMELLRFDYRTPVGRFQPLIQQLTGKLAQAQVITACKHPTAPRAINSLADESIRQLAALHAVTDHRIPARSSA